MTDYRDHYDTRRELQREPVREGGGFIGPVIALGVIALLFVSVFLLSGGGTGTEDINAPAPAAEQPATPPAQ